MTQSPAAGPARVVVLGGGLAGTLAAAALAPYAGDVLVLEQDGVLPATPAPRPRLPQAAHAHMLWAGGAEAVEALLPGVVDDWLAAGAHRIPIPNGMVSFSPAGWYRRSWAPTHYLISAGRDLLDWVVRRRVQELPRVRIRTGVKVTGLTGDATRVRGVQLTNAEGRRELVGADLVVDATGRGSRSTQWLRDIGGPTVRETVVDAGVRYASRRYRAPEGAERDWPVVHVAADPRADRPGLVATILSVEDGQWHVSLSGTRGGEPSSGDELFEDFARRVRHPLVAELLARAEPISGVTVFARTANRRRYFEQADVPAGFVALGDAATSLNPVYGHGMSVAALGAVALRARAAARAPLSSPAFARGARRAIARSTAAAWSLAVGQDRFYPGCIGAGPTFADRLGARYTHRLVRAATGNGLVVRKLTDVMALRRPARVLAGPAVLLAAALGPRRAPLDGPELTEAERAVLSRPPLRTPQPDTADRGI
ncbi:FAD-dependent oxidoreductase [Streptomyces sp. NPDC059851]|uniref:FAD-dependent oxidoreductase n=1 Tax=Streptomyces sp. NPDC059851 TaxID=3346971 RepID=UPI0036546338